jgi:galactokinase
MNAFQVFNEQVRARLGPERPRVFRAPGRVNLIGEHTDYNDGFVLPAAIDREIRLALRPRADRVVRIYATEFDDEACFDLDAIHYDPPRTWSRYVRGTCKVLEAAGYPLSGADGVLAGTVPVGAGLSSSAAVEVVTATAFLALAQQVVPGEEIAQLCQQAEHIYAGTNCGIMDQLISVFGQEDRALLIDCRSLAHRPVLVPAEAALIVTDSGVGRELASSAYNTRRQECEAGVITLQAKWPAIRALRDATLDQLEGLRSHMDAAIYRRCRHVITENQRVLDAVAALESDALNQAGALFLASHASLRDDYEVSGPELDLLVEIACAQPGVYGSRMTGAGFGGCTLTLADAERAPSIAHAIAEAYRGKTGQPAKSFVSRLAAGAGELPVGAEATR